MYSSQCKVSVINVVFVALKARLREMEIQLCTTETNLVANQVPADMQGKISKSMLALLQLNFSSTLARVHRVSFSCLPPDTCLKGVFNKQDFMFTY